MMHIFCINGFMFRPKPTSPESKNSVPLRPEVADSARRCLRDFQGHLLSTARTIARRRGTTAPDEADVEAAYRQMMMPASRSTLRDVAASVTVAIGLCIASYGINLATS